MASFIIQYEYFMSDALNKKEADVQAEVRRTLAQEFFDFLKRFGIIGLAIAFVIGQAASRLVTAFVNDIIDPFIGFSCQQEVLKR
jgi:large conductance mechanosensitive channel